MRLIDADALLTDNNTHVLPYIHGLGKACGRVIVFAEDIESAPTCDEVVHAHWITRNWCEPTTHLPELCEETVCSNCDKEAGDFMKYCPNCGAKMDEDVE